MDITEKWKIRIVKLSRQNWQWLCSYRLDQGPLLGYIFPCQAGGHFSQAGAFDDAAIHALEKHHVRL